MEKEKKPEWARQAVNEELINAGIKALKKKDESEDPLKGPDLLLDVLEKLKGRTNEEAVEILSMVYTILPKEAQEAIGYTLMPLEARAAMLVAHMASKN